MNNKACLEVKGNNDRIYTFLTDPSAPLGECYDALVTMLNHVSKRMEQVKENLENQNLEEEEDNEQ